MRHPAKRLKRSKGIVENASADLANEALIWGQDFSVSSVDDSGEVGQGESEHENDDNDPWESAIARLEGYGVDRREARAALEATQAGEGVQRWGENNSLPRYWTGGAPGTAAS